ncbi:MAG: HU family DNA-binding protein [Bdellovibrionales bacterium]|nr:HU family DNA-binding protein [Bdellovibrionales bacterium]
MNKAELIEAAARSLKLSKLQVESMLDATVEIIQKTVAKGEEVKLMGFGTFTPTNRKARTGRNPKTGKSVKIPASRVPKFRPGKEFKARVGR